MPPPLDGTRVITADDWEPVTTATPVAPAPAQAGPGRALTADDWEPVPTQPTPPVAPAQASPGRVLTADDWEPVGAPQAAPQAATAAPGDMPATAGLGDMFTVAPVDMTPDPDQRPGFLASLLSGVGAAGVEGKQLATGNAFTATEPPAPVERTFMGDVGYGLGHSAPTVGAMTLGALGGGAAGSAVGGPFGGLAGGILGGAAGGGLTDFAQSIIPSYENAIRRGLTHEAAVDEAYKMAAASGGFTAATAPLFGPLLKSAVANLLFHTAVTGPATGAVKQAVIDPAITGEPAPDAQELLKGAVQNMIGGGLTAGALHVALPHGEPAGAGPRVAPPDPNIPAPGVAPDPAAPVSPSPWGELFPTPTPTPAPTPALPPPAAPEPTPAPGTPPDGTARPVSPDPAIVPPAPVAAPVVAPGEPVPEPGGVRPPGADPTGIVPVAPGAEVQPVRPDGTAPGAGPAPEPGAVAPGVPGVEPPGAVPGQETPPVPGQELPKPPATSDEIWRAVNAVPDVLNLRPIFERLKTMPPEDALQITRDLERGGDGTTSRQAAEILRQALEGDTSRLDAYERAGKERDGQTPPPPAEPPAVSAPAPEPHAPGSPADILASLDKANAPDEAYREAFSTGAKNPLKPGETWRDRLVKWVESDRPVETTSTSAGRKVDYKWEVRPADALTPAEGDLQPRDRVDRVAAQAQQNDIYAKFDPERLHASPEADRGAPIIAPVNEDPMNTVEAGNNRVEVLKRIHAGTSPEDVSRAQAYRAMITRVTGQDVSRMENPVLVRRRVTPMTPEERKAFVREANVSSTQSMSAPEQARVDASNLSHEHLATLDPEKDLTSAANREFVNRWVQSLPQTEHNRVQDADGYLSAEGVRRLNAAILARAYGDRGTLARGLESTNDEIKGVSGALADAAPAMAKLRAGIEKGDYDKNYDISSQIVDAAERVRLAREKGIKRDDILNQSDAFNPLDPVTAEIVRSFYNKEGTRAAARTAMADTLRQYARLAASEAEPKGLLPGDRKLSPADILKALNDARAAKQTGTGAATGKLLDTAEPSRTEEPRLTDAEADAAALQARTGGPARPQRRARPAPGEPAPMPRRVPWKPLKPVVRAREPGAPLTFDDYAYSPGSPRYRAAFHEALAGTGEDPRTGMNKPIGEQISMLSRGLSRKFGFADTSIDPGVDPKITRDQLLNMHQNMQGLAHALGWSNDTLSLSGRLKLMLVPRNFRGQHWMGMYSLNDKTIHISGGSNSYAHEHWHAVDEYLSDMLNNAPNRRALFTWSAREGQLEPAQPVHAAFAHVLNTMFYGDGEAGLRRLTLEKTATQTDARGNPTKAAVDARTQIDALDKGASKLKIPKSEFRTEAEAMPNPAYYASAHELFARMAEAYTAHKMTMAGQDTAGVVKSDAGYRDNTIAYLKQAYPNPADRMRMFAAMDALRVEMERANVLPLRGPAALPPTDAHTLPAWHERPPEIGPGLVSRVRQDLGSLRWGRLFSRENHDAVMFPPDRPKPPPVWDAKKNAPKPRGALVQAADTAAGHWNTTLGNMERWIEQSPPAARPYLQKIRDMIGYDPGSGRDIAETFEGRGRRVAQKSIAELEDTLKDAGLKNWTGRLRLTQTQEQDLWHTLHTGDKTYPLDAHDTTGRGETRPISSQVLDAAEKIRPMFEAAHEQMTKAGIDVGYSSSYVPRMADDHKILADGAGYVRDMTEVNKIIIDKDLDTSGAPPIERLHKWWRDTPQTVRDSAVFTDDTRDAMNTLGRNLRRIAAINEELASGGASNPTKHDPTKLRAELDKLRLDNQDIYDNHKDNVRDSIAGHEAENRNRRINEGDPTDFVTLGPKAEFLRGRTLPPETDQIMRKWLHQDPRVAIPSYLHAVSRKVAYHEVFGKTGQNLEHYLAQASRAGMHGDYVKQFRGAVQLLTGQSPRSNDPISTRITNAVSAAGAMISLPLASISALGEPAATMMNGGNTRMMFRTYANIVGQALGSASAAERTRLTRQIGAVSSRLQGAAMASRFADYSGTPHLGRLVNNFFELGLSPAIRMIRAATLGAGNEHMKELLTTATDPAVTRHQLNRQDDARVLLRDWGLNDSQHQMMRDWMKQFPDAQPTPEAVATTREGALYEVAANRMLDRFNQNPTAAEKPMGGLRTPYGNMMLQLTAFPYSFWRNTMEPALHRAGRVRQRQWDRSVAEGQNPTAAFANAEAARMASWAGTAYKAAALMAGTGLMWVPRTYLLSNDTWKKHEDAGDLPSWILSNVISASGMTGPLDAVGQALTSLRYTSDVSALTEGPYLSTQLRYVTDMLHGLEDAFTGESNTNTRVYNGINAFTQLAAKPAMLSGLTWLAQRLPEGGPLAALITAASMAGTSATATRGLTDTLAGDRGTTLPKLDENGEPIEHAEEENSMTDLEREDAARAKEAEAGGGVPTWVAGLLDDVLMPIIKVAPTPLKVVAGAGAAAVGLGGLVARGLHFATEGEPPAKAH